jgi:hypothetical protein
MPIDFLVPTFRSISLSYEPIKTLHSLAPLTNATR